MVGQKTLIPAANAHCSTESHWVLFQYVRMMEDAANQAAKNMKCGI